jgi:hypothetical protein
MNHLRPCLTVFSDTPKLAEREVAHSQSLRQLEQSGFGHACYFCRIRQLEVSERTVISYKRTQAPTPMLMSSTTAAMMSWYVLFTLFTLIGHVHAHRHDHVRTYKR